MHTKVGGPLRSRDVGWLGVANYKLKYSNIAFCAIQMPTTLRSIRNIIESVDSISRDEQDSPLTQNITNAGISRARYTITLFKTPPSCSTADFQSNKCITSLYSARLRTRRAK